MRESPVASEKIAVDQASRRPVAPCSTRPSIGRRLVVPVSARRGISARSRHSSVRFRALELRLGGGLGVPRRAARSSEVPPPLCYHRSRPRDAGFSQMPNIKQQKKRVRIAAQERLENLRFRSTAKTLARRLREAVDAGDNAKTAEEHKRLVSWLDRAAARGAIHKNTAARRKAQADRLVSGKPS